MKLQEINIEIMSKSKTRKPRIILWDIETSHILAYMWGLWDQSVPHNNIVRDRGLICGAWKELGKPKVHAVAIKNVGDDYQVVKKLRDVLATADVVIHHNGDKFDIKRLNARLIYHGLDPLPKIQTVDTLKEVKKIADFSSNRLDFLAKTLTGKGKIHTSPGLWFQVMEGSKKALKEMVQYNKMDVVCLEDVYLWLLPYMKSHPHVGAMKGKDRHGSCPKCGSTDYKMNGTKTTAAGLVKQECQCKKCHGYFQIPIKK